MPGRQGDAGRAATSAAGQPLLRLGSPIPISGARGLRFFQWAGFLLPAENSSCFARSDRPTYRRAHPRRSLRAPRPPESGGCERDRGRVACERRRTSFSFWPPWRPIWRERKKRVWLRLAAGFVEMRIERGMPQLRMQRWAGERRVAGRRAQLRARGMGGRLDPEDRQECLSYWGKMPSRLVGDGPAMKDAFALPQAAFIYRAAEQHRPGTA